MPRTTSSDRRPRVDVSAGVKAALRDIRKELGYKSDSETIAYLIAVYRDQYDRITLAKDKQYRSEAANLERQVSM